MAYLAIAYFGGDLHPDVLRSLDARAQPRMGLRQASPADGLGRARMDVGLSAHQLVVSVAGVDQFGGRAVGRRSDHAPLRRGDKRIIVLLLLMLLPAYQFHAQRFNANVGSVGHLADRDLLLPAVVRKRAVGWAVAAGATAALAMLGKYYSVFLSRASFRCDLSSAAARLFRFVGSLDFRGHGIGRTRAAYGLARDHRCPAVRLCARTPCRQVPCALLIEPLMFLSAWRWCWCCRR